MGQSSNTKFEKPPVIEVAFQVIFPTLAGVGTPHFGAFWYLIRDEFPTIQAAARLGPIKLGATQGAFPENRLWLISKNGETLIQLQDDRFLFNWRQIGQDSTYPGYDNLYPAFSNYLERFCEFLENENSPIEAFTGFELHYVNHIYLGDLIKRWEEAENVISLLGSLTPNEKLFPLTSIRFNSTSKIHDSEDTLNISVESRLHGESKKELLNFEIRLSGNRESLPLNLLDSEFSTAHDRILTAFLDASTTKSKRSWGPK